MKKKIYWINYLKILACFLVILLHSISLGLGDNTYKSGLFIYYFGVFAVPLFFMINGYLKIDRDYAYRNIIKKNLRILMIMFFWNFVILLIELILKKNYSGLFYNVFINFFQKGKFPHFWFLGSLIIINFFLPLLKKIYNSKKFNIYIIISILICFIINLLTIVIYRNYSFNFRSFIPQVFRIWTWILYFLLGGYIKKYDCKIEKKKIAYLILFVLVMISISVTYQSIFSIKFYGNLYAESFYDSIIIIFTTFLIFVLFKNIDIKNEFLLNFSELTSGIYIIHLLILKFVLKILNFNNNYYRVIDLIITFIISSLIVFLINKIPFLKKFTKF